MTESDELVADAKPSASRNSESENGQAPQQSYDRNAPGRQQVPTANFAPAVEIHATKIVKILACCIVALIALHLLVMVAKFHFGRVYLMGFVPLFNLESENNVPTLFASLQLILAAVLLGICAAQQKLSQGKHFKQWAGLSAIFVFLAFDEGAVIHEKSFRLTQELLGTSGLFYYSWIIPFGIFALAVFLIYFRFLFEIPRRTAVIFFLSGAVFITGAIGMEMFEGQINEAGGYRSFEYMVFVTIEEILELIGIFAFVYGILDYMTSEGRRANVALVK